MDIFDNEINIISRFQNLETTEILLLPENSKEAERICCLVHDKTKWKKWIDTSAKNALPPDFYCDTESVMMDVMRIDDHESISKKGQVVNPTRVKETQMMKELRDAGVLDAFPNASPIVIGRTDLPTEQDHNYNFYKNSFARTVKKHIGKIANYKRNHPDYKTIFFVFDEASPYFEAVEDIGEIYEGKRCSGKPHFWFLDENFINVFNGSDVDYLIWYTPYKHCRLFADGSGENIELPVATVIDIKKNDTQSICYDTSKMVSAEV